MHTYRKSAQVECLQSLTQCVDDAVALCAGNHQRRAKGNGGAKMPAAASATNDQPGIPAEIDNGRELCCVQLLFRVAVLHQFHTDEQSLALNIANDLEIHQTAKTVEQIGPDLCRPV